MELPEQVVLQTLDGQETVGAVETAYPFTAGTDVVDTLVTSDGVASGELVKTGSFSVSAAATGAQTEAVAFTNAFPVACDAVLLTLTSLGTTSAVVNGGPLATSVTKSGFTASVDVTTAGTGNITGTWVALGH